MKTKTPKANLENYRATFFLIGLIVALGSIYYVFGFSKANVKVSMLNDNNGSNYETEVVPVTRAELPKPPPPPKTEKVFDISKIEITKDPHLVDNFEFNFDPTDVEIIDIDELPEEEPVIEEEPVVWTEQMPEFIAGGELGLRQFIAEHIDYPDLAIENEIEGTVTVRFVVEKDGSIGEVQIISGADPLLDKEAIRVIKSLPNFKPGMQAGRPVRVWMSVPIVFQLSH